jgi:sugar phosphate isomerase/epimerase/poly(3-hydroxybutyrate) depolymerase
MNTPSFPVPVRLRRFSLVWFAVAILAGALQAAPQLGLQTWTCRKMSFEEMVAFASEHKLTQVALFRAHVDAADPVNINAAKLRVMREAGLEPYTMYSAMGLNPEEDRKVFALARQFGLKFLVVEPRDQAKWPELLEAAKRHGVKLAVHNHWLETPYGDPATVRALLDKYPDLQVCLDVGWVTAAGFDAAEVFRSYGDRVIDLHFKDKSVSVGADGKRQWVDTFPGEGDVNFAGLFKAIRETGWSGTMAIETDSDTFATDPRELVQRSITFFEARWNASGMPLSFDYTRDAGDLAGLWPEGLSDDDRAAIREEWEGLRADLVALKTRNFSGLGDDPVAEVEIFMRQAQWALRYEAGMDPGLAGLVKNALKEGRRRAAFLLEGRAPWRTVTGRILRGHRSRIDGSAQLYGVVVPEGYDGSRPLRLDVVLHGSISPTGGAAMLRFGNWFLNHGMGWRAPDADYLEVYPLGRVTNGYRHAGHEDVFEAIEAVAREYAVDRDRIMLRGFSMGASGTWHIGLKEPDRFAALGPYMGYVDTRFFSAGEGNARLIRIGALPSHQERAVATMDAVNYAANAGLLPVIAAAGGADPGFRNHEFMARALAAENLQMINLVAPGVGHRVALTTHRAQVELMAREAAAGAGLARGEVRFVTRTLRYNRAHWVELLGLTRHDERAEILARRESPSLVTIERVQNISAFALASEALEGDTPRIVLQGRTVALDRAQRHPRHGWILQQGAGGWRQVAQPEPARGELHKRPGLQGPIDDAFTAPFLCVRGTGEPWNPAVQRAAEARLQQFAYEWNRYWVGDLPVKDDVSVTAEDLRTKHLILFGDPGSNRLLAQALPGLPVAWDRDTLTADGIRYPAASHLPMLVYPNSLSGGEGRYVVVNSGHTFGEDALASVAYLQFARLGDWAVSAVDARTPAAAGNFNEEWAFER